MLGRPPAGCGPAAPVRGHVRQQHNADAKTISVGRGSRKPALRGSKWGNPFAIRGGMTRSAVIRAHREWLANQEALLAALPELDGATLLCHCAEDEECRADNS